MKLDFERDSIIESINDYLCPTRINSFAAALNNAEKYINNDELIFKLNLKLVLLRTNSALIADAVKLLSEAKQKIFYMKYKYDKNYVYISRKIYTTPKKIGELNDEIISFFRTLVAGELNEFVFSKEKLKLSLNRLESIINYIANTKYILYIDSEYLNRLLQKKDHIIYIINNMSTYLSVIENTEKKVIIAWSNNSELTYRELSFMCSISEASVRRYIIKYKKLIWTKYNNINGS